MEIDPMEMLLLITFEKDPDSIYVGLEPQVFNDEINGMGHLVIGWRKDKKIDVYHEHALNLDEAKYSIAGAGLNKMVPVHMDKAYNQVNDCGVQVHYKFKDILGRDIEIAIWEKHPKKRETFGLLAPMGDAATHPTSLPMVFLHDFYFVRKNQTDILVSIGNQLRKVDPFPIPMDFQKMTFVRYSPKPLIATLNPSYQGEWQTLNIKPGQLTFEKGNHIYEIEWNKQSASIKSMCVKNNIHLLTMQFTPSFPSLNTFPPNTSYKGKFVISGHDSIGLISGEYYIQSEKEVVALKVIPSKGWKPKTTKLSTWFLFSIVKVFKKWPTTYQWNAKLYKNMEGLWHMQSKWVRTGKILKD
ncbi:hypothetical protein [Pararhodonellum marinum]|uniref:hypothetical protein n=1 Tax=Pararhodonellum marinum TaxID=2755358 RepID=UPI001890A74C|nr:hypothetical protein [Pararhodonellum marinum]